MFLLGVVTENFKSYTIAESEEKELRPGQFKRTESKEIVTYGVAANPFSAVSFLEQAIGVENLHAAHTDSSGA